MGQQREAVLRVTGDAVFLGHLLGRLPHRFAGRRLGDRGRHRHEVPGTDPGKCRQPAAQRLGFAGRHQDPAELLRVEDRDVGERFDPAGQDHVGVTHQDLVVRVGDRLGARGAGAIEAVGRNGPGKLGQQGDFARHVRRQDRGDHLAEDHLIDFAAVEVGAIEQLAGGMTGHLDGRGVLEDAAAPRERGAKSRHHHRPAPG